MRKESNRILAKNKNIESIDFFKNENLISFFIKEISLKGSLYLEDLKVTEKEKEEIVNKAVEMGFIIHFSKIGSLVIDPNFLGGIKE